MHRATCVDCKDELLCKYFPNIESIESIQKLNARQKLKGMRSYDEIVDKQAALKKLRHSSPRVEPIEEINVQLELLAWILNEE